LRRFFPDLIEVASPSPIGGTFFQDAELGGALTCTETEALILDALILAVDPRRAIEIGSYVGWSSAHLAWHLDGTLDCVDNLREGAGKLEGPNPKVSERFWRNMDRASVTDRVRLWEADSPGVLPLIAYGHPKWEVAFVDGWHLDGQPRRDVEGLLPHLAEDAAIVMHDLWMPDVRAAANFLCDRGYHLLQLPTPGVLGVLWHTSSRWVPSFIGRLGGIV
jgi:predicted O-methyltransferase YrrM